MEYAWMIPIMILLVAGIAYATARRFRRGSGCCSGGNYRPKKKRLPNVL